MKQPWKTLLYVFAPVLSGALAAVVGRLIGLPPEQAVAFGGGAFLIIALGTGMAALVEQV